MTPTSPAPSAPEIALQVVGYHYVRPVRDSEYPAIKGLELADFERQIAVLQRDFDVVDLETAIAFLQGRHHASRNLCLLTFDDGFRDHYEHVLPVLSGLGLSGVFFLITSTQEDGRVMDVHKNHFLTARLGFEDYRGAFSTALAEEAPGRIFHVDPARAERSSRFGDGPEREFKYLLNFVLPPELKRRVLRHLFAEVFGDEREFSRSLYLQWDEAAAMHDAGMTLGGHSHAHQALATLSGSHQHTDVARCAELLASRLPQPVLPSFCYPYGHDDSYTDETIVSLRQAGFTCAFTTQPGTNRPGGAAGRTCSGFGGSIPPT